MPRATETQKRKWFAMLDKLYEYREKYGNVNVPSEHPDHLSLGAWVKQQRREYRKLMRDETNSLTKERLDALEAVGFMWKTKPSTARPSFAYRVEELNRYKKEHGHVNVPKKSYGLGAWLEEQRLEYAKLKQGMSSSLTTEHIETLTKIGVVWELEVVEKKKNAPPPPHPLYPWYEVHQDHGAKTGPSPSRKRKDPPAVVYAPITSASSSQGNQRQRGVGGYEPRRPQPHVGASTPSATSAATYRRYVGSVPVVYHRPVSVEPPVVAVARSSSAATTTSASGTSPAAPTPVASAAPAGHRQEIPGSGRVGDVDRQKNGKNNDGGGVAATGEKKKKRKKKEGVLEESEYDMALSLLSLKK